MAAGGAAGAGPEQRGLTIRLENFEGPLDLLLFLIRRAEVSIYDIPIARITEQYLAYIVDLSALEMDRAAEFLVMAATLLDIKARMLLPQPPPPPEDGLDEEGEADPRAELVRQLEAYEKIRAAADVLKQREELEHRVFTRGWQPDAPAGPHPLEGISLADLVEAFREVVAEQWSWREVPREEIPLREKIREINWRLARHPEGVRFRDLFTRVSSRRELVVTFLAVLELIRLRRAVAVQDQPFGDIVIRRAMAPAIGPEAADAAPEGE